MYYCYQAVKLPVNFTHAHIKIPITPLFLILDGSVDKTTLLLLAYHAYVNTEARRTFRNGGSHRASSDHVKPKTGFLNLELHYPAVYSLRSFQDNLFLNEISVQFPGCIAYCIPCCFPWLNFR